MSTKTSDRAGSQPAGDNQLDPALEAVLAELCRREGPLTKTKAVKLPYLVDVVAKHALGRTITNSAYQTWEYGVVAPDVWNLITRHDGGKHFRVRKHRFSEGAQTIALETDTDRPAHKLRDEELEVIAWVAERFGQWNAGDLGALTKSLNTEFEPSDWGSNQLASTDEDAYARLSAGWQRLWCQLPDLALGDSSGWSEPITDPKNFFRLSFGA